MSKFSEQVRKFFFLVIHAQTEQERHSILTCRFGDENDEFRTLVELTSSNSLFYCLPFRPKILPLARSISSCFHAEGKMQMDKGTKTKKRKRRMERTTTRETGKRGIQRERGEQDIQFKPGKRTVLFLEGWGSFSEASLCGCKVTLAAKGRGPRKSRKRHSFFPGPRFRRPVSPTNTNGGTSQRSHVK